MSLILKTNHSTMIEFQEEATSSKADIIKQLRAADANKTKTKRHIPDKNIPGSTSYEVNKYSFLYLDFNRIFRYWMIMMPCLIKRISVRIITNSMLFKH